ncbi:hypothetical protein EV13_0670 [Prochlorococcus sp. MIT 0702]|nr:hypothetical protein EV12_2535 [Prochlorococcus sp. MIT 0701]KGG30027.1 hypothetical protein EV13_0670 [Prochlorococcus sp. MIT 0702]KGG31009.1 hypothetical protein EV14_2950 [Prochlorococcus sp. MIT 0703]
MIFSISAMKKLSPQKPLQKTTEEVQALESKKATMKSKFP